MDQDSDPEIAALKRVSCSGHFIGMSFPRLIYTRPKQALIMASRGHSHSGHHLHPPQEGPFCGLLMTTLVAGWRSLQWDPLIHQSTWSRTPWPHRACCLNVALPDPTKSSGEITT